MNGVPIAKVGNAIAIEVAGGQRVAKFGTCSKRRRQGEDATRSEELIVACDEPVLRSKK